MNEFLAVAKQAALAAGRLLRDSWRQSNLPRAKSTPIDLVTEIDVRSEEIIVRILRERFPDHAIVAEEKTTQAGKASYRWIIDPLDGTTNFVHAYPQFCVSIALEAEGEVVMGLVHDPLRDESFHAIKGSGAFLNGEPIATSRVARLEHALLATGFPYDRKENPDFYLAYFKRFLLACQGIRRAGSAALDLCYVASGRLDGFWEWKLHAWDTAAATLIVREAGGAVSDFAGKEFSIWGDQTLASNGRIHAEMLALMAELNSGG
ncbi:MAG TPA: inositol monophosphatase family protein [Candidatus Acidoferrales bacterium]|nr:inositol monophosphatase family protein [Candidatus Acidoferrales bacterium]